MRKIFGVFVLLTIFSILAAADVPPIRTPTPKPPPVSKETDSWLEIRLDKSAKDVRLVIPRSEVESLRAQLDAIDGGANNSAVASAGLTRTKTVASGLLISLGFVFAGVYLMRSRKIRWNTAAGGVLLFGGAALVAFANVPPGQYPNNLNDHIFSSEFRRYGRGITPVKVKIADDDKPEFKLIVPVVPDKSDE